MSLRRALAALDRGRVERCFEGAFDKCTSFEETGVMIDALADNFPALVGLVERLRVRIGDELDDEAARTHVVLGGVLVLLGLMELAITDDLLTQFPDLPDRSTW